MSNGAKEEEPHPREPFGQPTDRRSDVEVGDHKPGYDPSPPPTDASRTAQEREGAVLPPYKPDAAPKTPLAERKRDRQAGQKEEPK